ncbi:MAG: insulinase family protein [SAR202 cluster bacterium]|nr:insulinase family protein [SAR202 cluster bacterium]
MFSEGTSKRTSEKISEEIEHLAFRFKEDVSRNHIFFSINGLKNNLDSGMKLFADITQNPIFPEQETERLRSEILADITSSQDNANKVAGTAARAILYGGVNTEYGHPIIGSTKSIKNIQQKDLIEFNQNIFHKSKATFIAVGDIKSPELLHHIESNFSTDFFNHSDPISPPVFPTNQFKNSVGGIYVIDRPGSAQSVIRAGHLTIPRDHQDYFSLAFGNYVLGGEYSSRVNMNLRQDKGYSYGFYSSIDWGQHSSTWLIRGSVQTEVTFESVKEILFEINGINGSKPISSKEFEDSKQGLLKGIPSQFESSNQMLNQLIKLVQFNLPDNDFSESIKKIEALTLDEVNLSSKNHFKPDESVIVIVGDKEKFIGQLETLKLPIHIVDMYGE